MYIVARDDSLATTTTLLLQKRNQPPSDQKHFSFRYLIDTIGDPGQRCHAMSPLFSKAVHKKAGCYKTCKRSVGYFSCMYLLFLATTFISSAPKY